jgi:hypothetical protein
MIRKDLNIKKLRKEVRNELELERSDIVKCIRESDLDHEHFMEEAEKINTIDNILEKDKKKSKVDPTITVAIISNVTSVLMFSGLLVYENWGIIKAKAAERIMEKGIRR